jgi:hypothetical protein
LSAVPAGSRATAGAHDLTGWVRVEWHGTHAHPRAHDGNRYQASPHRHRFTVRLDVDPWTDELDATKLQEALWLYCLDGWSHTAGRVGLDEIAAAIATWARGQLPGRLVRVDISDGDTGISLR